MRPIRGDDDIVVAEGFDCINHKLLVWIHRQKALATEIMAGWMLESIALLIAELFPTLVETVQPGRRPAAETFEKGRAQRRKSLKDSARKHGAEASMDSMASPEAWAWPE
jgi:hypothetical protein